MRSTDPSSPFVLSTGSLPSTRRNKNAVERHSSSFVLSTSSLQRHCRRCKVEQSTTKKLIAVSCWKREGGRDTTASSPHSTFRPEMHHRHLGQIERCLPEDICDRILMFAGETGKIKLRCAALLGQPRGICSTHPHVLWAVFCTAWRAGLVDCCLELMLHPDAPMRRCGPLYSELMFRFLEPFPFRRFDDRYTGVVVVEERGARTFEDERMTSAYFLTVDPNEGFVSGRSAMRSSSSYDTCTTDNHSVLHMCVQAYRDTLIMGWPNDQKCVSALRNLYADGTCDHRARVRLDASLDVFCTCIHEIWKGAMLRPRNPEYMKQMRGLLHLLMELDPRLVAGQGQEHDEEELKRHMKVRLYCTATLKNLFHLACGFSLSWVIGDEIIATAREFMLDDRVWKESAAGRILLSYHNDMDETLHSMVRRGRYMQDTALILLQRTSGTPLR